MEELEVIINAFYGIDIKEKNRTRIYVVAKTIFAHFSHTYLNESYSAIGRFLNLNHGTIIYHVKNFDFTYLSDSYLKNGYDNLYVECNHLMVEINKKNLNIIEAQINYHTAMISSLKFKITKVKIKTIN